jgi:hypothetical protein
MRNRTFPLVAVVLLVAFVSFQARGADEIKINPSLKTLDVTIGGKPFTTYHFADDVARPYVRPFFWPVRAADGTEVTSDQAQAAPVNGKAADHPHHRSIWVAHGDVNGVDHWAFAQKGGPAKQQHLGFNRMDADGFVEQLVWNDLEGKPQLNETRTVKFVAYPDGARGIDVTVALTPAGDKDVTLADTKEAGLLSARVAKQISDKPVLSNSAGGRATTAKEEAAQIWGKKADWCDESGEINGKPYGVAIFDAPANPRHPTNWHARVYGLVAPNPFGLHEYDKKANPEHAGDFKIDKGTTATFRYRVIIHEGDAGAAKIEEKYKEFAGGK